MTVEKVAASTFHASASVRFVFEIVGTEGALENIIHHSSFITFHFKMGGTCLVCYPDTPASPGLGQCCSQKKSTSTE